jgi:hypothetical protein
MHMATIDVDHDRPRITVRKAHAECVRGVRQQ